MAISEMKTTVEKIKKAERKNIIKVMLKKENYLLETGCSYCLMRD